MPVARFQMPDGRVARFEVPEGTTPEQAQTLIEAELPKISAPQQQPDTESNWTLGNLGESFTRGLKQRGAGVLELGSKLAESAGVAIPEEYKQGIADIQNQYSQEGRGTGAVGFVGEVIGDPLTYIPIGGGAKNVVKGLAGAGALSGLTTSTGDAESTLGDMLTNAGIQAGTGAIAGKVTQKLMKPVSSGLDDVAAKNVSMLEREGVKLQPSQKTGSKALNLMEEAFKGLPFTSGKQARINEAQLGQFTKAALRRAGINSDKATPEILESAAKSFGQRYDDLISKAGGIKIDDDLLGALVAADTEASRRLGSDSVGRMVHSYIDDVLETGGKLDAKTYQNTRSALGRIAKGTQDPLLANVLTDLRNALDAAAERSMPKDLSKAWRATDKQYAAFKTIQKAMERTGQESMSGYVTPANLINAVKVGNKRFARGYGELNPLARAGKDIISSTLPDSGTATRTQMQNILTGGALAGGGATASGLTGAGAALFAPRVIQEAYNTRPVQRYLTKGITESTAPIIGAAKAAIQAARQEAMPSGEPVPQPTQQPVAPEAIAPQSSLQPDVLTRIRGGESGNNPNAQNPNSSASGLYQITDGTFRHYAAKLGIPFGMKNKPEAQEAIARALLADNRKTLATSLKREPTDDELILAHFAGAGNAKRVILNKAKPAALVVKRPDKSKRTRRNDPVLANQNVFFDKNGRARTGEELINYLASRA